MAGTIGSENLDLAAGTLGFAEFTEQSLAHSE